MARHSDGPWFRESKNAWYVWHDGRQHSLGVRGKANRKDAVAAWHRLIADGPKAKPDPKPEALTVREVIDAFLTDAEARLKPNTLRIYRHDLGTLCDAVGAIRADTLTPQHLTRWLLGLGVGPTTQAMTLRSSSACLGWAEKNDMLPANPARKVPKPKSRSRSADAVISDADHAKLMEAATPAFRLVLRVLHATGARPGEVCRIAAENFDREACVAKLAEHKTDRTGKPRLVFLPPDVCGMLKAQAERYGSGPLLRSRKGEPYTARTITKAMQYLRRKTGVKAIAYGYRHGFATQALVNGVPDATVAALLGHGSTAMLHRHYSHLTAQAQAMRDALARVRGMPPTNHPPAPDADRLKPRLPRPADSS